MSNEEHNTTETTKTYKVNCDKRNITGIKDFTVQVLNISQVAFQISWNPVLKYVVLLFNPVIQEY